MRLSKNRLLKVIGILITMIIVVAFYRGISRNFVDAHVANIRINEIDLPLSGSIDAKSREIIEHNPTKFVYITFDIETRNTSNYSLYRIRINPLIPPKLKEKVLWYDTTDAPSESIMRLNPTKTKVFNRSLIIKRDNYSDRQLIGLFYSTRFNILYFSYKNNNSLTLGYSKTKSY
ncbi:MAG: hypothetical protein ACM3MK_11560 [Chitinophagales bacterium]